jgi:hypothetical protein
MTAFDRLHVSVAMGGLEALTLWFMGLFNYPDNRKHRKIIYNNSKKLRRTQYLESPFFYLTVLEMRSPNSYHSKETYF